MSHLVKFKCFFSSRTATHPVLGFRGFSVPVRHLDVGPKGTYIAKKMPTIVKLEAGKKYYWCKCGLSKKQPFCDGSHKPTDFKPVLITLDKTKSVLLCRCKQTSNQPYCDMTHVSVIMSSFGKRLGFVK